MSEHVESGDLSDETVDVREVLHRVGDRWTVRVLGQLAVSPHRFGELRHALDGISQRVLSQVLRSLERDGFVRRTVYASVPPRVEYTLTPLGRSLCGLIGKVAVWCAENQREMVAARHLHDVATAAPALRVVSTHPVA